MHPFLGYEEIVKCSHVAPFWYVFWFKGKASATWTVSFWENCIDDGETILLLRSSPQAFDSQAQNPSCSHSEFTWWWVWITCLLGSTRELKVNNGTMQWAWSTWMHMKLWSYALVVREVFPYTVHRGHSTSFIRWCTPDLAVSPKFSPQTHEREHLPCLEVNLSFPPLTMPALHQSWIPARLDKGPRSHWAGRRPSCVHVQLAKLHLETMLHGAAFQHHAWLDHLQSSWLMIWFAPVPSPSATIVHGLSTLNILCQQIKQHENQNVHIIYAYACVMYTNVCTWARKR